MSVAEESFNSQLAVTAAVDRALAKQRDEAVRDVEAILDATLAVAARVAPAAPRVADILAEAGLSNQAFYRYFASKDDLMRAVFERGMDRLYSYLEHQLARVDDPHERIAAWIRGVLHQVTHQTAARQGAAIAHQLGADQQGDERGPMAGIRQLLLKAVLDAGSARAELDTDAISRLVLATVRLHSHALTAPAKFETQHLVDFCLRGLTV